MKFDQKILPKEIQQFLTIGGIAQAYTVSTKMSEWLGEHSNPDANILLCAAHYAWACAELTELEDDIIGFGEEAIELLERVLNLDPSNEEALKWKTKLQKKIKKAKREQQEILEWEKQDIDEMSKDGLGELGFYYFERATKNSGFAEKGYRYYQKLFEYDQLEEELPRDSLYHFATMAFCKYYSQGYEAAKELIEKTLAWKLTDRYKIYDFKITDVWMIQLNQLALQDDFLAFEQSFHRWYKTMKAIRSDEEPYSFDYRNLTPVVKWLIAKKTGVDILNYILTNCYPFLIRKKIDLDNHELVLKAIEEKLG
jgi:tetratricopeptide (TPR) repeat protein